MPNQLLSQGRIPTEPRRAVVSEALVLDEQVREGSRVT
jgi:hypothetical protein